MLQPTDKAKDMVASYWAIIMQKDKDTLLSWMNHKDKHLVDYGVPLVAKQCAIQAVDEIQKVLGGVWADVVSRINRSCEDTLEHQKYYEKVKQALMSM